MEQEYVASESKAVAVAASDLLQQCLKSFEMGFECVYRVDEQGKFMGQSVSRKQFKEAWQGSPIWHETVSLTVNTNDWKPLLPQMMERAADFLARNPDQQEIPVVCGGDIVAIIHPKGANAIFEEFRFSGQANQFWSAIPTCDIRRALLELGIHKTYISGLSNPYICGFYWKCVPEIPVEPIHVRNARDAFSGGVQAYSM